MIAYLLVVGVALPSYLGGVALLALALVPAGDAQ